MIKLHFYVFFNWVLFIQNAFQKLLLHCMPKQIHFRSSRNFLCVNEYQKHIKQILWCIKWNWFLSRGEICGREVIDAKNIFILRCALAWVINAKRNKKNVIYAVNLNKMDFFIIFSSKYKKKKKNISISIYNVWLFVI